MARKIEDSFDTLARQKPKKKQSDPLMTENMFAVVSILVFILASFLLLSFIGYSGNIGGFVNTTLLQYFGLYAYVLPILFFALSVYLWKWQSPQFTLRSYFGAILFYLASSVLLSMLPFMRESGSLGGELGLSILNLLLVYTSPLMIAITGFLLLLACLVLMKDRKPELGKAVTLSKSIATSPIKLANGIREKYKSKNSTVYDDDIDNVDDDLFDDSDEYEDDGVEEEFDDTEEDEEDLRKQLKKSFTKNDEREVEDADFEEVDDFEDQDNGEDDSISSKKSKRDASLTTSSESTVIPGPFIAPPLELLKEDQGKSGAGDTKSKMQTIQRTLEHFRIKVEMGDLTVGPTVTQFTLKPAQGVNLNKIVQLHDNLAMELGAEFLRIEAPIPGKSLVGIEIPNERKAMLGLRSMLAIPEFINGGPLTIAIGKSIIGKPIFGDLEKMPHLLVAGATKTGKSVTLQNTLLSLLYKNSPHNLKLIILDPKRVDFSVYNNLPHLYTPVIKEASGAVKALSWAIGEMERRYEILAEHGQVNVNDYNKKVYNPALDKAKKKNKAGDTVTGLPPKLPYIVIVFDEYNDFMLANPRGITPLITSLTQKGRAAGIHMILATQRPDVKVITGTIKANIPARIALKTTSRVDSSTILDSAGAENLLGNGDMLYMAADNPRLVRIQAPFVSQEEVKSVLDFIKDTNYSYERENIDFTNVKSGNEENDEEKVSKRASTDDAYEDAKAFIQDTGKASTSALQTNLGWGYNKAARIMNMLVENGVISEETAPGSKFREVLISKNDEDSAMMM